MHAPRAADLPEWSVVAVTHMTWIKDYRSGLNRLPWTGTDGVPCTDDRLDDYLAQGAQVLRVGDGSGGEC